MNVNALFSFTRRRLPGRLAIGVEDGQVTVLHARNGAGGRPEVTMCDTFRSTVSEAESLARLARELKLRRWECSIVLPPDDYQVLLVDPPEVPAEELKAALRWQVKSLIDYPVDEATLDFMDVPTDGGSAAKRRSALVFCSANRILEKHIRLYQQANVEMDVIEVAETAQRNLATLFETTGRALAMLSFTSGGCLLTFSGNGELLFARRVDLSLGQLVSAQPGGRESLYDRIVLEVQRSLDNFARQFHWISLSRLVVAPLPVETLNPLLEHLRENLDVKVEAASLDGVLDLAQVPELRDPGRQANCLMLLGAALRPSGKDARPTVEKRS